MAPTRLNSQLLQDTKSLRDTPAKYKSQLNPEHKAPEQTLGSGQVAVMTPDKICLLAAQAETCGICRSQI